MSNYKVNVDKAKMWWYKQNLKVRLPPLAALHLMHTYKNDVVLVLQKRKQRRHEDKKQRKRVKL